MDQRQGIAMLGFRRKTILIMYYIVTCGLLRWSHTTDMTYAEIGEEKTTLDNYLFKPFFYFFITCA